MAIVIKRQWRLTPFFAVSQMFELPFSPVLMWMYFSPHVSSSQYALAWNAIDQFCIVVEVLFAWEILEACRRNRALCATAWLCLSHAGIKLYEYYLREMASHPDGLRDARRMMNLILTFALAYSVYPVTRKEVLCHTKRSTKSILAPILRLIRPQSHRRTAMVPIQATRQPSLSDGELV